MAAQPAPAAESEPDLLDLSITASAIGRRTATAAVGLYLAHLSPDRPLHIDAAIRELLLARAEIGLLIEQAEDKRAGGGA